MTSRHVARIISLEVAVLYFWGGYLGVMTPFPTYRVGFEEGLCPQF